MPSLYISVIGLLLSSLTVIACMLLFWLVVFRWKVAAAASSFVFILVLLLILSTTGLYFWVATLQFLFLDSRIADAGDIVISTESVLLFLVFSVLAFNWVFVLLEFFDVQVRPVVETIVYIGGASLAAVLFILVMALGSVAFFTLNLKTMHAFNMTVVVLHILALVACFAVLALSVVGLIVVRRKMAGKEAGLVKLVVVAAVVFAVQIVKLTDFAMRSVELIQTGYWIVPDWFQYLLVRALLQTVQLSMLLYLVWGGARSKRSLIGSATAEQEMESYQTSLLTELKIPTRYEI